MTNHIDKARISNTLYEISPSPDGILDNTKYVSNDKSNTTEYINVDPITTTETNSSIFSKITTMIRNIRYIWSRIGTTDISSIGDSITSALVNSNNNATTKADNNTYGQVKIGDWLIIENGVVSINKLALLDFAYPIGTIYESTNDVSPSTFLGGTWEEYGSDRVLVGKGTYHSVGSTGGNRSISLSASNLPNHSHRVGVVYINIPAHNHQLNISSVRTKWSGAGGTAILTEYNVVGGEANQYYDSPLTERSSDFSDFTFSLNPAEYSRISQTSVEILSTGSGTSFNIEQPYVTVYRWRRTA